MFITAVKNLQPKVHLPGQLEKKQEFWALKCGINRYFILHLSLQFPPTSKDRKLFQYGWADFRNFVTKTIIDCYLIAFKSLWRNTSIKLQHYIFIFHIPPPPGPPQKIKQRQQVLRSLDCDKLSLSTHLKLACETYQIPSFVTAGRIDLKVHTVIIYLLRGIF